jgi:hypothetical protein
MALDRSELLRYLVKHYSLEELQTICFDLGVDYDNLGGSGKSGKARELIQYLERRGRLDELATVLREDRPEQFTEAGLSTGPAAAPTAPPPAGDHVFLSYSSKDVAYVQALAAELKARGFAVWIDDRLETSDRWVRELEKAVQTCAALVVVMTPDSKESQWVENEVGLAMDEHKPVFPLLRKGNLFFQLRHLQYEDVTGGQMPPQGFFDRLRQAIDA